MDRFFMESSMLRVTILSELKSALEQLESKSKPGRTCPRSFRSGKRRVTRRGATRRPADAVARRGMSPRVGAARLGSPSRPPEPEVMRTLLGEANAVAVPAADVRKQERAHRRLHQASARRAGHEAEGRCTSA